MREHPDHGTPTTPPNDYEILHITPAPPVRRRRFRLRRWEVRDTLFALGFVAAGIAWNLAMDFMGVN